MRPIVTVTVAASESVKASVAFLPRATLVFASASFVSFGAVLSLEVPALAAAVAVTLFVALAAQFHARSVTVSFTDEAPGANAWLVLAHSPPEAPSPKLQA